MKLLVVLRMMPDPACELELLEDSSGVDYEWLDFKLNDFDDQALEEAILLKEACGGEVIALACGEGAGRVLQMALARGADRAIEYETEPDEMISSRVIARDVAAIAKNEGVDLVLTGVQAAEDLHGQLAPYLSAILSWPGLSGTSHVSLTDTGLAVSQERGGGVTAHYAVNLPAVLGVQTASKAPRYVSGSKLREASKLPIATAAAEAERLEPSGDLVKLARPERDEAATSLGGTAEDAAAKFLDLIRSGAVA